MKKVLLSVAIVAAAFGANAQKNDASKLKFSVGVEAAAPIGDFGDVSSFGIGGSVQGDYWVAPELALTLNAGYVNFMGKDYKITFGNTTTTVKGADFGLIPVLAGIKYNFTPQLYGSAQIGAAFSTEKNGGTSLNYAPGIGYKFSDHVDALLKYTGYSQDSETLSAIGVRVAYTF
jgi:hypothetical protein